MWNGTNQDIHHQTSAEIPNGLYFFHDRKEQSDSGNMGIMLLNTVLANPSLVSARIDISGRNLTSIHI